tara:strand:+ start:106 stop:324 length:219 start_codon:yes stop_codon:yes gene_type:complete
MTKNDLNYPTHSDYDTWLHKEYKYVAIWEKMKEKYNFTDQTPIMTMAETMDYQDWLDLHNAVKYRKHNAQVS